MGYAMADLQTLDLILFAVGTFAAALVTGVAGFAFGIVAAAVWLYSLPPAQTTALIVAHGLIVQGLSVWKLRRSIKPARLLPFLAGAVIGGADWRRAVALDLARNPTDFGRGCSGAFQPLHPGTATARTGDRGQGSRRRNGCIQRALSAARPASLGSPLRSGARCAGGRATSSAPPSNPLGSGYS
jgi:hypothetical protein